MLTNKKTLLALSIVSALTLTACGSDNDDNVVVEPPVTPPVVTPPPVVVAPEAPAEIASLITVNVLDSKTQELVSTPVTVAFLENGVASSNVVDLDGAAVTSLVTTDGFVQFRLAQGASVSSLGLRLSGEGFLQVVETIEFTNLESDVNTSVSIAAAASAVSAVKEVAVTGNSVTEDTKIVAESTEAEAAVEVALESGTELLDESGNPVDGTGAKMQVTTADATLAKDKTSVADLVPAGLNTADADQVATPVAVANIVMLNAAGQKIKKFSKPITINLDIPASDKYKAGDSFSVSSYDEDKGTWTRNEYNVTLGAIDTATGKHKVSFATDHLTIYVPARAQQKCATPTQFDVTGLPSDVNVKVKFRTEASTGSFDAPGAFGVQDLGTVTVEANGIVVAEREAVQLCNGGTVPIAVTSPFVTETATFTAVCSNNTALTTGISGMNVTYKGPRSTRRAVGNGNGSYTLANMSNGFQYTIRFTPKGEKFSGIGAQTLEYTAGSGGINQTFNIQCDTTTGSN
jgi:hypothetical protein